MKGAKFAVVLLAATFATVAVAQIHGTPPSVTSIRIGGEAHGVPASVTSLGPNGFGRSYGGGYRGNYAGHRGGNFSCPAGPLIPSAMGCVNPLFSPGVNSLSGTVQFGDVNVRGSHRRPRGWAAPAYYPYAYTYPIYDTTDYTEPAEPVAPPETLQPVQPVQIQIQVEDKRAPLPEPAAEAPAPKQAPEPVQLGPPTILVFRDGHQQEVQNYAIVGKTLYDLGTFVAHKIPLADLDLPQTIKVNEDRGVDFTLPNSYKMD
ncbi:MAG TPA: hypothetical protein VFU76_13595 [Terriglobales bacterium]|nr:hypothetical protein [Terriglobales bacterium]